MLPIIIILANLIIRGPDAHLALTTPQSQWFTGQASWFDPWDINVYLTAINWGRQRHLLLSNRYDATDTSSALIYPFYTALGFITQPLPINPALTFHATGVLISWLLITQIWQLAKLLLPQKNRLPASILALFGGGLGWLTLSSADVSNANFTLHAALRIPHEGLSVLLFLIAIKSVYQKKQLPSTLATIALCLIHPYTLLPLAIIAALINIRFLFPVLGAGVVYYGALGRNLLANQSYDTLFHQTHIPLTVMEVVLGFGLLGILIVIAIRHRQKTPQYNLVLAWFFTLLILIFLPLPMSRLFVKSLWIPASFLASYGILRITKKIYRYMFVALCCFSTLFVFYRRMSNLGSSPWVRLPRDEAGILRQLPCTVNDVILASHPVANLIPTMSLCRTFAGHQVQTPQFHAKFTQVSLLFAGEYSLAEAQEFLNHSHTNYIFWGMQEQRLANRPDFPYPGLVTIRFEQAGVTLYEYPAH